MEWLKERIDDLMLEFDSGNSASDIAKNLTIKFKEEITRNAICGILHRMKLRRSKPPVIKKPKPVRRKKVVAHAQPPPPRKITNWEVEPPGIFRCTINELNAERCHWPFGDRSPYTYCGASAFKRGYCNFHYQKSLRPSADRPSHPYAVKRR